MKQVALLGSVLGMLVAVAACSSDGGDSHTTPATTDDYDDVAQALGTVVVTSGGGGEVGSLADSADLSIGILPAGVTFSASGAFAGSRVGLNYSYKVACTDSGGAVLSACGPATNAANVNVDWSGNLTVPNFSAMITRQGEWSISGLQGATATFDGASTFAFDAEFQSAFRAAMVDLHLDYGATYDGIVMQRAFHVIGGGAIHYTVKAERVASTNRKTVDSTFDMSADLSFATNGSATLVLDGSHRYVVNTVSGQVTRAN